MEGVPRPFCTDRLSQYGKTMIDIPLLDDEYRETFLYLLDEINAVDKREEAFILLNTVPEEYLNDVVDYFRALTRIRNLQDLH
jgi:hypothetical protein